MMTKAKRLEIAQLLWKARDNKPSNDEMMKRYNLLQAEYRKPGGSDVTLGELEARGLFSTELACFILAHDLPLFPEEAP